MADVDSGLIAAGGLCGALADGRDQVHQRCTPPADRHDRPVYCDEIESMWTRSRPSATARHCAANDGGAPVAVLCRPAQSSAFTRPRFKGAGAHLLLHRKFALPYATRITHTGRVVTDLPPIQ